MAGGTLCRRRRLSLTQIKRTNDFKNFFNGAVESRTNNYSRVRHEAVGNRFAYSNYSVGGKIESARIELDLKSFYAFDGNETAFLTKFVKDERDFGESKPDLF
jgi:hypothetical protein